MRKQANSRKARENKIILLSREMEQKSSQRLDQSIFLGEDVCAPCASARVKGKRVFLRVVFFSAAFLF
jgi:hypothetical protein